MFCDSGVYLIINKCNSKAYIGQSLNVKRRIARHKSELKHNHHNNRYLQREFNKYGMDCFEFTVLDYCLPEELDAKEICLIAELQTMNYNKGYNMVSGGNSNKIVSELTRLKMTGENNPQYGKHLSEEQKEIIRLANLGSSDKLTEQDVEKIKIALVNKTSCAILARKYNVVISTIDKINNVVNWCWVREDLNELLLKNIEEKKILRRQRNEKINDLFRQGISVAEIKKQLHIDRGTITRALEKTAKDILAERNELIVNDFKAGLSKDNIMQKHNISSTVYVAVTKDAFREKIAQEKSIAIKMRVNGVLVQDIAKVMKKHRTTITEWTKHLLTQ